MVRRGISWASFELMVDRLVDQLQPLPPFDLIIGVARGGLPIAVKMAHALSSPNFGVIAASRATSDRLGKVGESCAVSDVLTLADSAHRVLLVDDVIGSGRTAMRLTEAVRSRFGQGATVHHAALFADMTVIRAKHPDLLANLTFVEAIDNSNVWVDFPWETTGGC